MVAKLDPTIYPRLKAVFADQKYHNRAFEKWLASERPGVTLVIQSRPTESKAFKPLKVRLGGGANARVVGPLSSEQKRL